MKNLINYLSKKSLSLGNGSGMTRKRLGNDSGMTRFSLVSLICLCMLTIGIGNAWGAEEVIYTLTPYDTGSDGTSTGYAGATDASCEDEDADITITWNVTGNSNQVPWRIGGKGGKSSTSTYDRVIYSKNAISNNVTKIVITHGAASSITVNSMTVVVSKNSDFSSPISTLTPSFVANNTVTINRPDGKNWSDCYYKIIYNVSIYGDKNKYLEFSQAEFYAEAGGGSTKTLVFADNLSPHLCLFIEPQESHKTNIGVASD